MKSLAEFVVNVLACAYIIVFNIIYLFPTFQFVRKMNVNYTCVITGGFTAFVAVFWFWRRKEYMGPPPFQHPEEISAKDTLWIMNDICALG